MKSIYLIGSLRNPKIPLFSQSLRKLGFDVFDSWYAPGPKADLYWRAYTKLRGLSYKEALADYSAQHIFDFDLKHLNRCDLGVLLMPAGKSARMELGYLRGQGKRVYMLFESEPARPDVMDLFASDIYFDKQELFVQLRKERDDTSF